MLQEPQSISKAHLAAGRAVDQLRRQLGIVFEENNGALLGACPVEGITPGLLSKLRALPNSRLSLLLTGARARHVRRSLSEGGSLGLAPNETRIDAQNLSLPNIMALADPLADKQDIAEIALLPATSSHNMLLTLARYASLLPALLIVESTEFPDEWLHVAETDVRAYWAAPPLDMVPLAEAALPIEGAEGTKIICFRQRWGTSVHLALVIGDMGDNPLVRIHSSCITGDILGSLRCDCGDQLKLALAAIKNEGAGLLIYLHQEGRGIGIANKLRAYRLQEQGVDTYEANLMLGFEEDERDFSIAATMLKKLGVNKIRMLTNNPHKMAGIEKAGIKVTERVALIAGSTPHNQNYLNAKSEKAGHLF